MTVKKIILSDIKKSKLIIISIVVLNVLVSLAQITQPLLFKKLFDEVFPRQDISLGIFYIIILVIIPIVFTLISSLILLCNKELGNRISKSLRLKIFNKIIHKGSGSNTINSGETINRMTSQVGQLSEVYIVNTFMSIISNTILLITTLVFMLSMSVKLTLIAVISLPLFMVLFTKVRNYTRNLDNHTYRLLDEGINYLTDLFSNFKAVQIHNGQKTEEKKWENWNDEVIKASKKSYVFHHVILNLSSDLIVSVITGIIYGYSLFLIVGDDITIGTLMAFIVLLPRLHGIFKSIFTTSVDTDRIKVITDNLNDLLLINNDQEGELSPDFATIPNLEINNLSFRYSDDKNNIKDLTLKVEPGQFLGIVGMSGSGKTTLFELLHKHVSPAMGTIKINGINIADYKTDELREYISYTPQTGILWNRSVLENIIYPLEIQDLSKDQMQRVNNSIQMARIEEFINSLPEKLNTNVTHNGKEFSGGEVQRILLARTFMNDSKMLLLDEYTSALDAITESEINEILTSLKGEVTVLVIAHRLSTINGADLVAVMHEGELKELGTVPDLLKQGGIFKDMFEKQTLINN